MEKFLVAGKFNPIESWKKSVAIVRPRVESSIDSSNLNFEQRKVLNHVKNQLRLSESEQKSNPLRLICFGAAGTGKSVVIKAIIDEIENQKFTKPELEYHVMAYTATAANEVNGDTIHSSFGLHPFHYNLYDKANELNTEKEQRLQRKTLDRLNPISWLLIDEASHLGLEMFGYGDKICRSSDPPNSNKPFGGKNVLLFCDLFQLPPVADLPLFSDEAKFDREEQCEAKATYNSFTTIVFLQQSIRQQSKHFSDLLNRVARKVPTTRDLSVLNRRRLSCLSEEEKSTFSNAIYICSTNKEVDDWNR